MMFPRAVGNGLDYVCLPAGWSCGRRFAPILARLAELREDLRRHGGRSARTYGSGPRLRRVPRSRLGRDRWIRPPRSTDHQNGSTTEAV